MNGHPIIRFPFALILSVERRIFIVLLADLNLPSILRSPYQMATALAHSVSGSLAGIAAMTLLYPLESARLTLALQQRHLKNGEYSTVEYQDTLDYIRKTILKKGWKHLYKGLNSALLGVGISSAVYFFWYSALKRAVMHATERKSFGALENIAVASTAGVLNVFITMPIWVVNTRMTVQNHSSIVACIRSIVHNEGWSALYKGLLPSLILVSNPAIQFVMYEQLVRTLSRRNNHTKKLQLSAFQYFILGAVAKAVATVVTYPHQVLKSREQASKEKLSSWQTVQTILREEGASAFFNGMGAKMSQTVTNSAIMFALYEKLVRIVLKSLHIFFPSSPMAASELAQAAKYGAASADTEASVDYGEARASDSSK